MVLRDVGALRGPILILCTHNAVRSPIAEFFLYRVLGEEVKVFSAGLDPREIDPFAVAVMAECGIDLSDHRPRGCSFYDLENNGPFGLVIVLSRRALARGREIARASGAPLESWDVPEPPDLAGFGGSRMQILEAYRAIRDDIARHVGNRFNRSLSLCSSGAKQKDDKGAEASYGSSP